MDSLATHSWTYYLTSNQRTFLWIPFAVVVTGFLLRSRRNKGNMKDIRGPPRTSWLYGNQVEFHRQSDVGQADFAWNREFGGAWKVPDCFGGDILMVADPEAIHHTLQVQGYNYPKTRASKQFVALAFGRGVSWAADETHVRHRKLMNPAFTAQSLRVFYDVFRRVSALLTDNWRAQLQMGDCSVPQKIDISRGLTNATLDIIGEAVFDYHFGSLDQDGKPNEFSDIFHNLFADSNLFPPPAAILFTATWAYIPEKILRVVEYLPFRQFVLFRQYLTHGKKLGKDLIENKAAATLDRKVKNRDILSILVEANKASDSENKLDEDEVLSQVTTLLFAGHETTACTLTWLMYELAHHPEDQSRIRGEIEAKRAKFLASGQKDFTITDFESMPFLNACIKEVLRYHPVSPWVTREAAIDDVVPLSKPIVGISGKQINQLEIPKGTPVLVSTCAYNRLPSVWGEDADKWNPSRFLNTKLKDNQVSIGMHANLLTFSAGLSGCIGYKFALLEMQSTTIELVENFEFAPPLASDGIEMLRVPVGAIMSPMVKGKFEERTQMPLRLTLLR